MASHSKKVFFRWCGYITVNFAMTASENGVSKNKKIFQIRVRRSSVRVQPSSVRCGIVAQIVSNRTSEIMHGEEKNTLYWANQSSQDRTKIAFSCKTSPTTQPRRKPFHMEPMSPICLSFKSRHQLPLSSLTGRPSIQRKETTKTKNGNEWNTF